jgi:8-oxo-dGTP diphosphatase
MEIEDIKRNRFWAGAILFNPQTQQILMQKRDAFAPVNPNKWALFGGGGEPGEDPLACLVRELKEELSVDISPSAFTPLQDYLNERLATWRYTYVAEHRLEKSEMVLGEGEDFDWIPFNEVLKLDLTDTTRLDIEFFLQSR